MPRLTRIWTYLALMFPPAVMIPASLVGFLSLHFGLQALGEPSIVEGELGVTWRMAVGVLSLFGFQLLLRVYDEIKDYETDLALGKAGDPRYAKRPVVTGLVKLPDIEALRDWVTWALIGLNVVIGVPQPFLVFLGVYGLCWLSSRYFFWPAVSSSLPLQFVTHNPLSLAIGLYVVAVYGAEFKADLPLPLGWTALLLVGLWLPVAAWEVARKVRLPDDETDYETYSKVLGWRLAGVLPGILSAGSAACLCTVLWHVGVGGWWLPSLFAALPVGASLRLLLAPSSRTANLRPFQEAFLLLVNGGLTVLWVTAFGLKMGV